MPFLKNEKKPHKTSLGALYSDFLGSLGSPLLEHKVILSPWSKIPNPPLPTHFLPPPPATHQVCIQCTLLFSGKSITEEARAKGHSHKTHLTRCQFRIGARRASSLSNSPSPLANERTKPNRTCLLAWPAHSRTTFLCPPYFISTQTPPVFERTWCSSYINRFLLTSLISFAELLAAQKKLNVEKERFFLQTNSI